MDFSVQSKILSEALLAVGGFCGTSTVSIEAKKNRLLIHATKDGTSFSQVLSDLTIYDTSGKVTVDTGILTRVIARRGEIRISLENSTLTVATTEGRKFSATVNCLPYEEVIHLKPSDTGYQLDAQTIFEIQRLLPSSSLSSVYLKDDVMFMIVKSVRGKLRLAVYDNFHIVSHTVEDTAIEADTEFCVPVGTMSQILRVADGKEFVLSIEENRVYAKNSTFFLSVPKQESSLPQSFDNVDALEDSIAKFDSSAAIPFNELYESVLNSLAIADSGKPIEFSTKKNKLLVHIKTTFGTMDSVLEANASWGAEVHSAEPYLLHDVLRCIEAKEVVLHFVSHQLMYIYQTAGNTKTLYGCNIV